ncbi:hypothetical protein RHL97_19195 [Clostridioides difficile]|nr:hypothetical protein [Clostridioides difficile]
MKLLIFNDSKSLEVQAVQQEEDTLHVRMIHVTPEEIKELFKDEFSTKRMVLKEDNKEKAAYENYTVFSYIKEDAGGIYEVEMVQAGKDAETRLTEAEKVAKDAMEVAENTVIELQDAIAELTMLISSMAMGGE